MSEKLRIKLILLVTIAVLACGFVGSAAWLVYRDDRFPIAASDVIVPDGSSVREIGMQLQSAGIINSARLFSVYCRLTGRGDRIQAAEYSFPAHQTIVDVVGRLTAGGRLPAVWITIPEGYTAAQIGRKLAAASLVSQVDFMRTVRRSAFVFGGTPHIGLEGYLFPDTYLIPRRTTADEVAQTMWRQFQKEVPSDYFVAARRLRLTAPQVVVVASMIEREAKVDAERPLIASVIYNRLRRGMPLEIDATVEYALPRYKTELSYSDLAVDSPYNTYVHAGLPPTPISNAGKASLDAAFHPAMTPFLYYVYKGNGRHVFSETLDQHKQNERRYLP